MRPLVEGKWLDDELFDEAVLGLDLGGDIGLEEAVLAFDRANLDVDAVGVSLAAVGDQEEVVVCLVAFAVGENTSVRVGVE